MTQNFHTFMQSLLCSEHWTSMHWEEQSMESSGRISDSLLSIVHLLPYTVWHFEGGCQCTLVDLAPCGPRVEAITRKDLSWHHVIRTRFWTNSIKWFVHTNKLINSRTSILTKSPSITRPVQLVRQLSLSIDEWKLSKFPAKGRHKKNCFFPEKLWKGGRGVSPNPKFPYQKKMRFFHCVSSW